MNSAPADLDYRMLFRSTPSKLLVLSREIVILEASDAYLRETATQREGIVGRPLFDVFPQSRHDVTPGMNSLRGSLERVLRSGVPDVTEAHKYSIRRRPADGGGFEERYWSAVNVPTLGADGEIRFIIHRVVDVTDLVRIAEANAPGDGEGAVAAEIYRRGQQLREAERQLEATNAALEQAREQVSAAEGRATEILESIADAFYSLDREWRFTYVNHEAAQMLQRPRSELLGKCVWEDFPEAIGTVFDEQYHRVVAENRPASFETYYDPLHVWVAVRAYPSAGGLSAYLLDITDQKEAEEEAALLRNLALRIGEAETLDAALEAMLQEVCQTIGWNTGEVWGLDEQRGFLVRVSSFTVGDAPSPFSAAGEIMRFAPGQGLIGRVWKEGEVVWWPNDDAGSDFRRTTEAEETGLHAGIAVPIRAGDEVVSVMAFYHSEEASDKPHLARMLTGVAAQLGNLIERKRVEEALRENEEKFRQIAENIREIVWMYDPDFTRTIYVSSAYEEITGRPLETAYADPFSLIEAVHPEDIDAVASAMRTIKDEALESTTFRLRRLDGEVRWLRSRGCPIRNERGEVYRVVGTTEDITERKQAELELARAEAHYRRLFEGAPYGIYALDTEGRFTQVNPAGEHILERSAEEVIGRHFGEVVAPSDLPLAEAEFARVMSGAADDVELEIRVRRPSGEERLLRVTKSAIRDGREITGSHGIALDITEEVEREKNLRRAERLASIGTLIGGVAHELSNPLHSIRNFAELMLLDERSPDDREALEIIMREADRAAKVVSDLRLSTRQTQEKEGTREFVDLNEIVRHVVKIRRYSLDTANVSLREDLAEDLPAVLGSRGALEQVVLNLVLNAEQALAEQAADKDLLLTLRTRVTPEGVALHVVDNGPGISTHDLERIFDPFFTTKSPGEGTGLGLSLVHKIVIEHGGQIHVESALERGADFRVDLPRAPLPGGPSTGEGSGFQAGRSLRILVVDDEQTIRTVSVRYLEHLGHQVDAVGDGRAALRLIEQTDYDVIVSDLRMPGLGGAELYQRLKGDGRGLERRLMFVTGDPTGAAARAISGDGLPLLVKPIRMENLARAIEESLKARGGK